MGCKTCGNKKVATKTTTKPPEPKKTQSFSTTTKSSGTQTFYHDGKLYEIKR
jgi:hypothetical protein